MKKMINGTFRKGYLIRVFLIVVIVGIYVTNYLLNKNSGESKSQPDVAQIESEIQSDIQPEEIEPAGTFRVDSVEALNLGKDFDINNCYITNRVAALNRLYIDDKQVLWGYGSNENGQLGIGAINDLKVSKEEAIKIAENVVTVDISTNCYFTIYVTEDGNLYGMGNNLMGVLGQPVEKNSIYYNDGYTLVTEPVLLMEDVVYARAGMYSIVALKSDGSVWWWGEYKTVSSTYSYINSFDLYWTSEELMDNPVKMMVLNPTKIMDNCIYATTGDNTGAAITKNGELYTWGFNLWGECGVIESNFDFIRNPTKVLEHVKMVWPEQMAFNDNLTDISETFSYHTTYYYNLFAELEDGTLVGCGRNLGDKVKTIAVEGDLIQETTDTYSDTFLTIGVIECSDKDINHILSQCEFGKTEIEVEKYLIDNKLKYLWYWDENNSIHPKYMNIEDSRYFFYFNKDKQFVKAFIQDVGSFHGHFMLGMSSDDIERKYGHCKAEGISEEFTNDVTWKQYDLNGTTYTLNFFQDILCSVIEEQ